jgi:nitroreductase
MINNEVIRTILSRQTIREYLPRQISDEQLETLIAAAKAAPSARNKQPCHVRFVQDAKMLHEMHLDFKNLVGWDTPAYTRFDTNPFYHNAPTFIFIYGEGDCAMDAGLMAENICIAAQSMGLGTVIVGSAGALFNHETGKKWNKALHLPDDFRYQIGVGVGYPNETPEKKPRFDDRFEVV